MTDFSTGNINCNPNNADRGRSIIRATYIVCDIFRKRKYKFAYASFRSGQQVDKHSKLASKNKQTKKKTQKNKHIDFKFSYWCQKKQNKTVLRNPYFPKWGKLPPLPDSNTPALNPKFKKNCSDVRSGRWRPQVGPGLALVGLTGLVRRLKLMIQFCNKKQYIFFPINKGSNKYS